MGIGSHNYGGQKFPDLPSACMRTREAGGLIQTKSKGLRMGLGVRECEQ